MIKVGKPKGPGLQHARPLTRREAEITGLNQNFVAMIDSARQVQILRPAHEGGYYPKRVDGAIVEALEHFWAEKTELDIAKPEWPIRAMHPIVRQLEVRLPEVQFRVNVAMLTESREVTYEQIRSAGAIAVRDLSQKHFRPEEFMAPNELAAWKKVEKAFMKALTTLTFEEDEPETWKPYP